MEELCQEIEARVEEIRPVFKKLLMMYLADYPVEEVKLLKYSVKMLQFPDVIMRDSAFWRSKSIRKPGLEILEVLHDRLKKNDQKLEVTISFLWLRRKRDQALADSDKTQLADFPCDQKERVNWREYRQYLRKLPTQYNNQSVSEANVMTFEEWKAFFLKN